MTHSCSTRDGYPSNPADDPPLTPNPHHPPNRARTHSQPPRQTPPNPPYQNSVKRTPDGPTPPSQDLVITAHVAPNSGAAVRGVELVWRINYGPEQRTAMAAAAGGAAGAAVLIGADLVGLVWLGEEPSCVDCCFVYCWLLHTLITTPNLTPSLTTPTQNQIKTAPASPTPPPSLPHNSKPATWCGGLWKPPPHPHRHPLLLPAQPPLAYS